MPLQTIILQLSETSDEPMPRGHARYSGDERATVIYRGDDDALSTRSYDTDDSLGGNLEKRCAALKIDGRSPEVLYALSVCRRGRVVGK